MHKKYFVWNIDDGLEQDKKIIEILKEYHMGATFNLNSGMYGDKTYESRIGNLGMMETPASKFRTDGFHLLPYAEHFRIKEEELRSVYEDFEIASHTLEHRNLKSFDVKEKERQILKDVENLSSLFDQKIVGFAYPYGVSDEACTKILQSTGIRYARTIKTDKSFRFPQDPLHMPMSCWHVSKKAFETLDAFINARADEADMFFLMFAHGYEFDFNTSESNWDKFEEICKRVSAHADIICCSTKDAFRMHEEDKNV